MTERPEAEDAEMMAPAITRRDYIEEQPLIEVGSDTYKEICTTIISVLRSDGQLRSHLGFPACDNCFTFFVEGTPATLLGHTLSKTFAKEISLKKRREPRLDDIRDTNKEEPATRLQISNAILMLARNSKAYINKDGKEFIRQPRFATGERVETGAHYSLKYRCPYGAPENLVRYDEICITVGIVDEWFLHMATLKTPPEDILENVNRILGWVMSQMQNDYYGVDDGLISRIKQGIKRHLRLLEITKTYWFGSIPEDMKAVQISSVMKLKYRRSSMILLRKTILVEILKLGDDQENREISYYPPHRFNEIAFPEDKKKAMTTAERAYTYRKNIKEDPVKSQEYKKKDADRKKQARALKREEKVNPVDVRRSKAFLIRSSVW